MNIFFPLSFKKCNKLDEYIYTYFLIIPIILLNNFFYNKIIVGVIKIKEFRLQFLLYCRCHYLIMVSLLCYNLEKKTFIFLVLIKIKIS